MTWGHLGCQQPWPTGPFNPAPGPASISSNRTQPVRETAEQELGPEAGAEIPELPPKRIVRPDPGADAFVDVLAGEIAESSAAMNGPVRIGLRHVRNQSRASAAEFRRFLVRLAGALTDAAVEESIIFVDEPDIGVDFELLGTAYLVTAGGIDQWELFLRMSPATASWTVWEAPSPLRVIRHPRPGQPQVLAWPVSE